MTHERDNLERIGPYKILSVIGEGGMGIVYLAEQKKPVRRRVALKLIKRGMDSKAILARFQAERQALALMDHPTIAKVYEAGTTEHGQPFFAMEHVKGVSLTDYCERRMLSLKERLLLFTEICHGVQHAHQKAIIHRDLKPSNILIAEEGGKPVPKIIDFGLAKALGGQRLSDMSLFTDLGVAIGTPEYMSPEQLSPSALDVDTRTDVYSLGVILYRILTNTLPFDAKNLRKAAQIAVTLSIHKKISEEELQKPSTRVSRNPDLASPAASKTRAENTSLTRQLRGDLDWITMKALAKDRAQRYATATDLAADIVRHLTHEPVLAGPPSNRYKLKKFVRKNAGTVASLLALFVLLTAGGTGSTLLWIKAEQSREDAIQAQASEAKQKQEALTARNLAQDKEREAIEAQRRETQQRAEAERERDTAQRQRDELLRLSDIKRLQDLLGEIDQLWPANPGNIRAMEEWRVKAEKLARNYPTHRASLEQLRQTSIGQGDDPVGRVWLFADTTVQWRHDILTQLVTGLQTFSDPDPKVGTIANIDERLAFARNVRRNTIEQYDVEWEETIASIRDDCPQYHGLTISPQLGLVPLGKDPGSGLWEFSHIQTGRIPERSENGELVRTDKMGLVFVLIPGGTFLMGAQAKNPEQPHYDNKAEENEGEVHEVTVKPFFLSKYEMTQSQWEEFVGKNPSRYDIQDYASVWDRTSERKRSKVIGLHPVEQVSWEDCRDIMNRLALDLPTETQWEYAARAHTSTVFSTGNDVASLQGRANLADSFAKENGGPASWIYENELEDGYSVHAPVGSFLPNPFGLHDIHGNVWEWCHDRYKIYLFPTPGEESPLVPGARSRVCRGGSFDDPAIYARSAYRNFHPPETRDNNLGCRPSRLITD